MVGVGRLVRVSVAYTSQRCSRCSHTTAANRRSQAAFHCVRCDYQAHADINASVNLLRAGQAQLGAASSADEAGHQPQQWRARKPAGRSA